LWTGNSECKEHRFWYQLSCQYGRIDIRDKSSNYSATSRADPDLEEVTGMVRHYCKLVVWKTEEELNMKIAGRT
jgi:hypothetical protein